MSTFGQLYREARCLLRQRQAESLQHKRVDIRLSQEIDDLKRIMSALLQAFAGAGGRKAD